MKKIYFLLPFALLGCKSGISTVNQKTSSSVAESTEIIYQIEQNDVSDFLKYLSSDELEGRETGTPGIEKAAVFLEDFFKKNNVKPYFSSYRDTLTNFKAPAYNIAGWL
jgi:hypothetical protein